MKNLTVATKYATNILLSLLMVIMLTIMQVASNGLSGIPIGLTIILMIIFAAMMVYITSEHNTLKIDFKLPLLLVGLFLFTSFILPLIHSEVPSTINRGIISGNVFSIILVNILLVPIFEELIFRNWMIDLINYILFNRSMNELIAEHDFLSLIPALVFSTFYFVSAHGIFTITSVLVYTLLSTLLLWARITTKDTRMSIILHSLWNAMALTLIL